MKAKDIKPNTIYKVKVGGYYPSVRHYVLTGTEIKPELLNDLIRDPSGNGRWSSKPTVADRIYVKPVIWEEGRTPDGSPGEWIAGDIHIINHGTQKGEWGQMQLRSILEEASIDAEMQRRQNEEDLDRAPELVEKAIEFYLDIRQDGVSNLEDARILRAYGSDLVRNGYYHRKYPR